MTKNLNNKKIENKEKPDFEAKTNLTGFFDLLLKVDMRNNPENYKKPKENDR